MTKIFLLNKKIFVVLLPEYFGLEVYVSSYIFYFYKLIIL